VTAAPNTEDLLRELAPQVLGSLARRYGDFADAEDAVQEALIAAAERWPADGRPDNPLGWLIRAASRRLIDVHRRDGARRRREELAASWSVTPGDPPSGTDDTLRLFFLCCHPSLGPGSAIPLALRAVGGLTTREIAAAFLVSEATMGQRISRAKSTLKAQGARFELPAPAEQASRVRLVLHTLYLLFNEGYAVTSGPDLTRVDLTTEAIRLTRAVHRALPDDPETAGLLALMLLTDARRTARTGPAGELVPLDAQDRSAWDRAAIVEGVTLVTAALRRGVVGEYQLQAAIAAVHDEAAASSSTDWPRILSLYDHLERLTTNPMVSLNRAVALSMVRGPTAGLDLLRDLDGPLGNHPRLASVRAHLLEMAGDVDGAVAAFRIAAARTTSTREQQFLLTKAAALAAGAGQGPESANT
jgi:RNA polymerase sigma factor (sigma-70 family)